ncbi:MAG: DinB family protein [Oscillospiraceae bacterium]|nr:DinB family protein [Oscillospiraceae bacterium]
MKYLDTDDLISEKHKTLNKIIRRNDKLEEAKKLFLEIHAALHMSAVSGGEANEIDVLFSDLTPREFKVVPSPEDETIAWAVWHLARIEDMVMNILVNHSQQMFNDEWNKRMNTAFTDTGVEMTGDEIIKLSNEINVNELLAYRNAVGQRTREIIAELTAQDMKRAVLPEKLSQIRSERGTCEKSEWLLEYWGSKDIAGLLLMPPTRHLMMHLNDCIKWKQKVRNERKRQHNGYL